MQGRFLQNFMLLAFLVFSYGVYAEKPYSTYEASQSKVFDQQEDWEQFFYTEGRTIGKEIVALEAEIFDLRRKTRDGHINIKPFIARLDVLRQKVIDLKNLRNEVYQLGRRHIQDFNEGTRPDEFRPFTRDSGLYPNSGSYFIRRSAEIDEALRPFINMSLVGIAGGAGLTGLYHLLSGADISRLETVVLTLYAGGIVGANLLKWWSLNRKFNSGRENLLRKVEEFWIGEAEFARGLKETTFLIPEKISSIEDLLLWISFRITAIESPERPHYSTELSASDIHYTMRTWESRISQLAHAFQRRQVPEESRLTAAFNYADKPGADWMRGRPKLETDHWFLREGTFRDNTAALATILPYLRDQVDIWDCKRAIWEMTKPISGE